MGGALFMLAILEAQISQRGVFRSQDVGMQMRSERNNLARLTKTSILSELEVSPQRPVAPDVETQITANLYKWLRTPTSVTAGAPNVQRTNRENLYAIKDSPGIRWDPAPWTSQDSVIVGTGTAFANINTVVPEVYNFPGSNRPPMVRLTASATNGLGREAAIFLLSGPVGHLGTLKVPFKRTDMEKASFTSALSFETSLWKVPVTNYNFVVYSLAVTGGAPPFATPLQIPRPANYETTEPRPDLRLRGWRRTQEGEDLAGNSPNFHAGVKPMVMTMLKGRATGVGANLHGFDPSTIDAIVDTDNASLARWPFGYRERVSFCWNLYEWIMDPRDKDNNHAGGLLYRLIRAASLADRTYSFSLLNGNNFNPLYRTGGTGDASVGSPTAQRIDNASAVFSPTNQSPSEQPSGPSSVTIRIDEIGDASTGPFAVVDARGNKTVTIVGDSTEHAADKSAVIIVVRREGPVLPTNVTFTGSNARPVIIYISGCRVGFANDAVAWSGALFLDPRSTAVFPLSLTWTGHLSLPASTNWVTTFPGNQENTGPSIPRIRYDSSLENRLSGLAPAMLLVAPKL
jgi:hypothetical protein